MPTCEYAQSLSGAGQTVNFFERGIIFPRMSPEPVSAPLTKVCPTCGTRLAENATRCLVCGTEFSTSVEMKKPRAIQANRMPEITLSLPAALGLLALFLIVGATLVFAILRATNGGALAASNQGVATGTATLTPTPSASPSPSVTLTSSPLATPTDTPLPTDSPSATPNSVATLTAQALRPRWICGGFAGNTKSP